MKNYQETTKDHYKDSRVAESYYKAYNERINLKNFRVQMVAKRERRIVEKFLDKINPSEVLDIPAGTGKLLLLFKERGLRSCCCDISEDMLKMARQEAKSLQYNEVDFSVCDAEKIKETFPDKTFDLAICLRLLHRVPNDVKKNILAQLSQVSGYAVVSFGLDSGYYRFRRKIKNIFFKKSTGKLGAEKKKKVLEMLKNNNLEVVDEKLVLPILSQEVIFLVKTVK